MPPRSRPPPPFRARVLQVRDLNDVAQALARTESDPEGVAIMAGKGLTYLVDVDRVPLKAGLLLKQEMLALGADAAHHRDVAALTREASRTVLVGTWAQYQRLFPKLRRQPFRLKALADTVEAALRAATRRSPRTLRLAHGQSLRLGGGRPRVMGVVNVTPDSFSDGGRFATLESAVAHGRSLVAEGADLLDIGGESTRPGATPVPRREELRRVLPVIKALAEEVEVPISIDTRDPQVAQAAVKAGASLVNDVTGLSDPRMRRVVARAGAGAMVMHMRGTPGTMQKDTIYEDLRAEVFSALDDATRRAREAGVGEDQLVVDPGLGFGKSSEGSLELLGHLSEFRSLGYPVAVGASRKSFLGVALGGASVDQRLEASLAAAVLAAQEGADIIRVHDVGPTVKVLAVTEAVRRAHSRA